MKFLGLELGSWKYLQFREKNSKKYQDYFLSPGGARYTLSQMVSMGCRYVDAAQKRSLTASQLKKEEEMIQMKIKQRRESRAQQDKTFLWRVLHAKMVNWINLYLKIFWSKVWKHTLGLKIWKHTLCLICYKNNSGEGTCLRHQGCEWAQEKTMQSVQIGQQEKKSFVNN